MSARPGDLSGSSVAALLDQVNGADPAARLGATRELFRRGPAALSQLERAGAESMSTVSPARGNVVYTLLNGDLSLAKAAPDTFGLHVEAGVTAKDVERMGVAHGFRLAPGSQCRPAVSPICSVQLLPGKNMASVLQEILTTEARVATVNLNYVEP